MSGRAPRPPFPMGPRDSRDFPRFMRETSEWVELDKAMREEERKTENQILAFYVGGLVLVFGAVLWVLT